MGLLKNIQRFQLDVNFVFLPINFIKFLVHQDYLRKFSHRGTGLMPGMTGLL